MAAEQEGPPEAFYSTVPTAALAEPVEVPAVRAHQAGHWIYGSACPECSPDLLGRVRALTPAERAGAAHVTELPDYQRLIWLNAPGRILCRCGTHLRLTDPTQADK